MNAASRLLQLGISSVNHKIRYYGGIAALIVYSSKDYFFDRRGRSAINRIIVMQIYFTGNKALKIVGLVALSLGIVTVIQSYYILSNYGVFKQVGDILNIVIIRGLGPDLHRLHHPEPLGNSHRHEIGTMMVNDEINALEMLGISSLKYVVFPRIAGMIIAGIFLTIYFNAISLIGGFLVGSVIGDFSFDTYINYIINSITMPDIIISIVKSAVFIGEGPFSPTELTGPEGEAMRQKGGEYGATTGRPGDAAGSTPCS